MSKVVLFFSIVSLSVLLFFGLVDPNSPVVWMASTSDSFAILRGALIIILIGLVVTNPPRNFYLRTFVGIVSVGLATWALNATYNNQMSFLDTLALLQFSISAGLAALERDYEEIFDQLQDPIEATETVDSTNKTRLATT